MTELVRDGVTTCRIWVTANGLFVLDGHRDAAFLRYGKGDQVHPEDRDKLNDLVTRETESGAIEADPPNDNEIKQVDPPANKMAKPSANKSGSGLTVNRLPRGEGRP